MKRTPTRAPAIRQVEGYHARPLRPCDAFEAKAEGATARRGGEAAMIGAAVGDGGRCFAARRALSSDAPAAPVTEDAARFPRPAPENKTYPPLPKPEHPAPHIKPPSAHPPWTTPPTHLLRPSPPRSCRNRNPHRSS